jgi:alpha-1,6-mannosyltransferase
VSSASSATGTGSPRLAQPDAARTAPARLTRALTWASAIGIGSSILIMIVASAARHSPAVPPMPWPPGVPPVEIAGHLPVAATYIALWAAAVLGGGGVIAGLAAVARGTRYPAWLLIAGGLVAVAAFSVLPPAGSTDALSYATFGRMAALGHNPYVMTPNQLARSGDPLGQLAIQLWRGSGSLYGPLATFEQQAAAHLGGASAARIVFWLKLWNAIVFGGMVLLLDRLLRSDPARRARAHLLWSVNPLVLWALVAGGPSSAPAGPKGIQARRGPRWSRRWAPGCWSGWPRISCSPTCCWP